MAEGRPGWGSPASSVANVSGAGPSQGGLASLRRFGTVDGPKGSLGTLLVGLGGSRWCPGCQVGATPPRGAPGWTNKGREWIESAVGSPARTPLAIEGAMADDLDDDQTEESLDPPDEEALDDDDDDDKDDDDSELERAQRALAKTNRENRRLKAEARERANKADEDGGKHKERADRLQAELDELYADAYATERFVEVVDAPPATKYVLGSNSCRMHVRWDERTGRILVIAVLDNLVKGAAGQAVQAFNVLFGLAEE
ncbi:MAG: hypothetical protein KY452_01750, partial [Actinobacteria bacterium]|nr:hypothetical protein [Actinomycetota bacterium]